MDKPRSVFVDFIPEGEEEGSAFGKGGYQDFVPPREPKKQTIEEESEIVDQDESQTQEVPEITQEIDIKSKKNKKEKDNGFTENI